MFKKPEKKQDKREEERMTKKRPLHAPHGNTKSLKLSNNLLSFGEDEEYNDDDDADNDDTET